MHTPDSPHLFQPLRIRDVTLKNRVLISPMCQYSATDGKANEWHLVHLGQFALGGAGTVMFEATAIDRLGCITPFDLGLWNDEQIQPLARIVDFLHEHGSAAGIQLSHAGRKGSSQPPWWGYGPLTSADADRGAAPWETVSCSSEAAAKHWPAPRTLTTSEISDIVGLWTAAAKRADAAGFDVLEIHAAHGYLLHQFLSPLSNHRSDRYGDGPEGRMRLLLEVATHVREVWPMSKPLFVRISTVDGDATGWTLESSIELVNRLRDLGVDVIDCSSSGLNSSPTTSLFPRELGFQVPLAKEIRNQCRIATVAVGLIIDPWQAERILSEGSADLIAIGREALLDPRWPLRAALSLKGELPDFEGWPEPYRWGLARREPILASLGLTSSVSQRGNI